MSTPQQTATALRLAADAYEAEGRDATAMLMREAATAIDTLQRWKDSWRQSARSEQRSRTASMIDDLIKPELAPEKKLQPPARWRTWWRIKILNCTLTCEKCGVAFKPAPGEVLAACCLSFPSQEVADIDAARYIPNLFADYVGAYREGERP